MDFLGESASFAIGMIVAIGVVFTLRQFDD
jgi:hypothetical protein